MAKPWSDSSEIKHKVSPEERAERAEIREHQLENFLVELLARIERVCKGKRSQHES